MLLINAWSQSQARTRAWSVCNMFKYSETKQYRNANVEGKPFKHALIYCTTEQSTNSKNRTYPRHIIQ